MVTTEQRRTVVAHVRTSVEVSERRACRFLGIHRAVVRYQRRRVDDPALLHALTTWAAKKRRWGVPRLTNKMRRLGFCVNPKRIARMCRDGRLLLKRRKGRKRVAVVRIPHLVPTVRISVHVDHPFRSMSITRFGPCRSLVSVDVDHLI